MNRTETSAARRRLVAQWIAENNFDSADREIDAALAKAPDDAAWQQLRGLAAHRAGRSIAAIKAFETAALLAPLSPGAQLALGECCLRTGQNDLARTILGDPLLADRMPAVLLAPLARGRAMAGDAVGAMAACRSAAERMPEDDEPLRGMAFYMNRLGYAPQTILGVMRRAWSLRPDWSPYRLTISLLLERSARHGEAYAFARTLSPEFVDEIDCRGCLMRLLNIFIQAGDEPRADVCRRRLLVLAAEQTASRHVARPCCGTASDEIDIRAEDKSP